MSKTEAAIGGDEDAQAPGMGNAGAFALMTLIWGATWAAVKVGVDAVPPVFFAFLRYGCVAAILATAVRGVVQRPPSRLLGRVLFTSLLINTGTYGFLFWGMQYVASGISGLVNLSLIPVGLFGLSILLGHQRARWLDAGALALGMAGLALLFSGKASFSGEANELWGAGAIVAGTFCYCLGSVLSRPLLDHYTPMQLAGVQAIIGAGGLLAMSLLIEPISMDTLYAMLAPAPLAGLAFLVLLGTIVAYTIYLRLVRDWGAPKAGLYAFISPIVALVIGWLLFDEVIGWREMGGAAILMLAAALAMGSFGRQNGN